MAAVVVPLTIRDLTHEDLPSCTWSGSATYLAACPPSGLPVAIGGMDYAPNPDAGTLWPLAMHGAPQSCGIGTLLIEAAERRIRARGRHRAELAGEECNPRARALYERLGYVAYDRQPEAWDEEAEDGSLRRYETVCILMHKELR